MDDGQTTIRIDSTSNGKEVSLAKDAQHYNLTEHVARRRELSRTILAGMIVGSLVFIIVGTLVIIGAHKESSPDDLREVLHILISPTIGIVGAVMGFYFGSKGSEG